VPGHPDYQNYANWRGPLIASNAAFALTAANPFNASAVVTNYASLCLDVTTVNTQGANVALTYFTDAGATVQVGSQSWDLMANVELSVMVPVLGNFVKLAITTVNPGAGNVSVVCFPTNTPVLSARYQHVGAHQHGTAVTVLASSTQQFVMPRIVEGPMTLFYRDRVVSNKLSFALFLANNDGSAGDRLYFDGPPATVQTVSLLGHNQPMLFQCNNTDAVTAHTFDFSWTVDGR
jgi:hypothetical protein